MEEEGVVILNKNCEEVTLGEIERDATDKDISEILVLGLMPKNHLTKKEFNCSSHDSTVQC